jgi:hypothetical protein
MTLGKIQATVRAFLTVGFLLPEKSHGQSKND